MRPHAHVEPLGNPFQGHGRLGAQPVGNSTLRLSPFKVASQIFLRPVQARQPLLDPF